MLLDRLIAPGGELWERFRDAPAAKHFHQAYRHGLLEHTLSVAQGVSAAASFFPGIDRDVAITGALLHDIGKLEAYNDNPLAIDMTDLGRLIGEIPLGYYRVRREIESIEGFDPDLGWAVLHIILSHHGMLEHGSPVDPGDARGDPRPRDGQPRRQARHPSTGSSGRSPTARPGRASTAVSPAPPTSATAGGLSAPRLGVLVALRPEAAAAPASLIRGRSGSPGWS